MSSGRLCESQNATEEQSDEGERWGCLVQDRDSRDVPAYATGPLGENLIERAVTTTVKRTLEPRAALVELWLARLSRHPYASLSPTEVDR